MGGAAADSSDGSGGRAPSDAKVLLAGQNRLLEQIAAHAPLGTILEGLVRFIEAQAPNLVCSVLLVEAGRLHVGAAPGLPAAFNQAVEGAAIGPMAGSCGTAAFTRATVVVTDIATDARWAGYPSIVQLALTAGFRACWSTPIVGGDGAMLGTFAIYYRTSVAPDPEHRHLIEVATHLAGIAIEHSRAEAELADRARRLAEADRRKDEFLALLAHELRNPLAPIAASTALLRAHAGDATAVTRHAAVIGRQVRYLVRMVEDLLDVSRITHGTLVLRPEPTTLEASVDAALETTQGLFETRKHTLLVSLPESPVALEADPVRLAQVFANLLTNAATYTEPGGKVELRVTRNDNEVTVSVRDNGIGIAAEQLNRVCELFFQASSVRDQTQRGLGIGLALARHLVELHGGRLTVQSAGLGQGTEVLVHLNVAPSPAQERTLPSTAVPLPSSPRPRRVLLVDDNADAAESLADALRLEGHEVQVHYDASSALSHVASFCPEVAILDIALPGMDGYELAKRLRARTDTAPLYLIALSGFGQECDRQLAKDAGFDLHLVKPADVDCLAAILVSCPAA